MAPESYYFLFSIIAVFVVVMYLINAVYYRLKKKTFFGRSFKPGTTDYRLMQRYTNNRKLIIVGVLALLCVTNLVFDIYRLLQLPNQDDVRFLLIFSSVFIALITVAVIIKINQQFGKGKNKKGSRKDNDSWLS